VKNFDILKKPLFVALDTDDLDQIRNLVKETHDIVGGFKVGPRLLFRFGPSLISEIAEKAPVFVDCKFYDIPSTMESAIKSVFDLGASFCTMHTSAGPEAISTLANLEIKLSSQRPFYLLGVTMLTSFNENNLPINLEKMTISEHVVSLTKNGLDNGLNHFVCSPQELVKLKELFPNANFVCPGVRSNKDETDDQKRVATAEEALSWGASALVIGRPILQAKNPREFIKTLGL
jgi:orotidine-5'-phosphate decarboxylase